MGIGGLARFREEDDIALLPEARGVMEVEARSVDHTQHAKYIGEKVEKKDRLKAVRARGLLGLEVRHGLPYRVHINNVQKMLHDDFRRGVRMVVEGEMKWGRLRKMSGKGGQRSPHQGR